MTEHSLTRAELLRRGVGFAAFVSAGPGVLEALLASPASAAGLTTRAGGGTLLAAIAGDPKTMDPHRTTLAVFHNTIRVAVFDALVKIDDKLQIVPSLAESWKITPKTATFSLRKGVTFHDGTPFDAKAVAFNINRIKAKATASNYAPNVATVKSVAVKDSHTIVFNLSAPGDNSPLGASRTGMPCSAPIRRASRSRKDMGPKKPLRYTARGWTSRAAATRRLALIS